MAVARTVLSPRMKLRRNLLTVSSSQKTEIGKVVYANSITLTPGTLSLDVSPDRSTLRVHAMFGEDPDAVRRQLKEGMERWVRDALGE